MALYERFMGLEFPRIPVHQFRGVAAEWKRGEITSAQARTALGLSVAEAVEAQTLVDRVDAAVDPLTTQEIEDVLFLAEQRIAPYDTVAAVKARFGV
jgi:hypothetical protein